MENSTFAIFNRLDDPRDERGKKYRLIDIVMLALYGTLIGFEDFTNMSYYLKKRESELIEELGLEKGVPSHDTFSAVFRVIDVRQFMKLFVEWTKMIIESKACRHIAIDGKAVRAATKKAEDGNIPYVLNAFLCGAGITIGQKPIDAKTNEITEIPKLLDLIDIKDSVVTVDAIGTQSAIMNKITEKGGDFCLQLKANQKQAFEDVDLYFNSLTEKENSELPVYKTTKKEHGRIEKCKYFIVSAEEVIRGVLQNEKWEHVKTIGKAELTRIIGEKTSKETHYHVLSFIPTAEEYASYARSHWEIENSLYWALDIHLKEDRSTANCDNAIANLSLLRKMAFNFTKLDSEMAKKTTKKKMIDFMTDISVFKRLVFEAIPTASYEAF